MAEAARLTPAQLRKVARRSLAAAERSAEQVDAHENSSTKSEEDAAWEKARFTWHHKGDGTTSGHFTVPTFAGSVLIKAIQQIASPRRFAQQAAKQAKAGRAHAGQAARVDGAGRGAHTGQADPTGAARATPTDTDLRDQMREDVQEQVWRSFTDSGDWANRYGRALVELLEHLPTDQLSGKVAATIVVTLDHRTPSTSSPRRSPPPTPASRSPPAKPGDWPATPGSCRPCWADHPCRWTSAGRSGSSPNTNGSPSPPATTPAPRRAATGPTPGPSCTTKIPGTPVAARI